MASETPRAFEELQRELHRRLYRFLLRLRLVLWPFPVVVGGFVVIADSTLWRRVVLVSCFAAMIALNLMIAHGRQREDSESSLEKVLLVIGAVFHPIVMFATGGVLSPVVMAMLLICFVASTVADPKVSRRVLKFQITAIVAAALLESSRLVGSLIPVPFQTVAGAPPAPAWLVIFAGATVLVFIVSRELGCRIQRVFAELLDRAIDAREESLRLHQEQLAELTLLSAEIAHELKNPLASVKGLAALIARRSQGEPSEPLVVLRREVDRMQTILEEFLNFSRPLVPLSLASVDLGTLVAEVVSLHQGMSELRSLQVEFEAKEPVQIECDPRKVRQIVVNLLQNALDASTSSGRIELRVSRENEDALVVLDDEGRGLDPNLAGRYFEAGVTSKDDGSGLGLNVARGLARQHGGDLTLAPREPRGCRATLRLPLRPAALAIVAEPGKAEQPLATLAAAAQGRVQP